MNGKYLQYLILLAMAACANLPAPASAQLGTAGSFAVLGASTVTNTNPTTISGNLGVYAGTSITGFPPGVVTGGTIHVADAVAQQAQSDASTAYNTFKGLPCNFNKTGVDLGGLTLTSGVYCFSTSAQLTGTLVLDAQGNPNARFVFQIGSTLTVASNSSVQVINGGSGCNVFWQVGSSAVLGTGTTFEGNILAQASITLNHGASIVPGRALALTGAVTMDNNVVSIAQCAALPAPDTTAPTLALTATIPGPPQQLQITAQDTGGGLANIVAASTTNATVSIPPFTPGTTGPVVVTVTRVNQGQPASVTLQATDVAGNVTRSVISFPAALPPPSTTAPSITLTGAFPGPPAQLQITVQGTSSGLASIAAASANNVSVSIAPFSPGTKSPVVVTITQINPGQGGSVTMAATDVAGKVTRTVISFPLVAPAAGCAQIELYLTIAGVNGGVRNSMDQATLNVGGCVTLNLLVVRQSGSTISAQDVSVDANTRYFTDPLHGTFAGNVFCVLPADCNRQFPVYAVYHDPCTGTNFTDTAHITVVPCPRSR